MLNTLCFALCLEQHPDVMHLVAGVTGYNAVQNVFDCDGFGLANYFSGRCVEGEYEGRKALYVDTLSGRKIVIAAGGGREGDYRRIKGNTYGMAYVTEANECDKTFVQEVFDRTLSSSDRKVFHDLNPKDEGHFYYGDILSFHENMQKSNPKYGYNYGHFSIADNLSMSQKQVDKVLATYDKGSVWYRRDVLGLRCRAEGLVYPMFERDKHVCETIARSYERFVVSADYGILNATSMGLWGLCDGVWYRVKEFYYSGRDSGALCDSELFDGLCKLVGQVRVERVIVDPSAASFITLIRKSGKFTVKKADNAVISGISACVQALHDGKIMVNSCCKDFLREIGGYVWDSDSDGNGLERPLAVNDHAMDDFRYFVKTMRI